MPRRFPILCEVLAQRAADAAALGAIARTCARDLRQPLTVRTCAPDSAHESGSDEPVLTLHLPVALASSQHQVWCLACRLACFCPTARVTVLVRGESAFAENRTRRPRPASAA